MKKLNTFQNTLQKFAHKGLRKSFKRFLKIDNTAISLQKRYINYVLKNNEKKQRKFMEKL